MLPLPSPALEVTLSTYQILSLQPNKSKQNKETYFLLPSRFVICGGVGNIADLLLKYGHSIPIPEPHWGVKLSCPGVWSLPRNGAPGECTQEGITVLNKFLLSKSHEDQLQRGEAALGKITSRGQVTLGESFRQDRKAPSLYG